MGFVFTWSVGPLFISFRPFSIFLFSFCLFISFALFILPFLHFFHCFLFPLRFFIFFIPLQYPSFLSFLFHSHFIFFVPLHYPFHFFSIPTSLYTTLCSFHFFIPFAPFRPPPFFSF